MPDIPLYFTILRDPVEVFISMWDYTEASKLFFENQKLEDFVMLKDPKPDQQIGQIHLNNTMMWDFGFGSEHSESISAIEQKIKGMQFLEPRQFANSSDFWSSDKFLWIILRVVIKVPFCI